MAGIVALKALGFQSTPPVAQGRSCQLVRRFHTPARFQSTPPVAQGRSGRPFPGRPRPWEFQSTPPVAQGRSLRRSCRADALTGFNPRPRLPRGEAGNKENRSLDNLVSIHAPGCPGAKRLNDMTHISCIPTGFNPRPRLPRGEAWQFSICFIEGAKFQSTPPVAQGRSDQAPKRGRADEKVSIHAPGCPGAKR